jgi:hypothetical protein
VSSVTRLYYAPYKVFSDDRSYWLEDAAGTKFGLVYFKDAPDVTLVLVRTPREEARKLVMRIAGLPDFERAQAVRNRIAKANGAYKIPDRQTSRRGGLPRIWVPQPPKRP